MPCPVLFWLWLRMVAAAATMMVLLSPDCNLLGTSFAQHLPWF
jgi:hypothetical protein